MTIASLVLAGLAALLHLFIWTMESITWRQPSTWKKFGVESQEQADSNALMAFNQGFYNLFLGVIAVVGIVFVLADKTDAGWALLLSACGSMFAASVVLRTAGAAYTRAALMQGTLPFLAVVLGVLAIV